jgi:hypothetical protein
MPTLLLLSLMLADPRAVFDRAVADFKSVRIGDSVRGFDDVAKAAPSSAPHLWQRGIALYYAGRYEDCREQFESHRTVNPNDVENAAWHFLCVARATSPAKAKRALLPVGPDGRVPMREVYSMFRGESTPEQVLKRAAGAGTEAVFYAHLYVGLYAEATGQQALALKHISEASQDRYAAGGYMHMVAQVHLAIMQKMNTASAELWNFDRLDRLGGHATTVRGNPRVIDTPKGKAIEFDGVDDALFLDVHPLAGAETFTWEVIFRPDRGGRPEQRFFHLNENGSEARLLFETRLVGDDWYLDSFANSGESKALMRKDRVHRLGEWYHVAMVYDGKEFRNYVNGELEGAAPVKLKPQGAGRTSVGVRINLVDYFKGAVRLSRFSRRALTPGEFLKP